MCYKIFIFLIAVSSFAHAQTPTPVPTPVKGFIDPCKLQTMSAAHAAWKAAHCN